MATKILRRCLNGRDHVEVYYNDDTQTLAGNPYQIHERLCGQLFYSDVPWWLGSDEMMKGPILEGTDIYLQIVGTLLYRVKSKDAAPYAEVRNEAYTEFTLSFVKQDVSSYGGSDGAYTISINDGSGYFQMRDEYSSWYEPVLKKENLKAGTYNVYVKDLLTNQVKNVSIIIDQSTTARPDCLLVIEGIEVQNSSSETARDGKITVYASGVESMEYKLNSSGVWQDSNIFTGLYGFYTVYVRNKLDAACEKTQNVHVDYDEEIQVHVMQHTNVSCFAKANGVFRFSVGPGISSYYTYLWSDGSTKGSRYDLAAGNYQLTITTGHGTTKTIDVNISIDQYAGPWDVEITIDRNNVYVDPKGQSLWYEWSDGATVGSRENLPRGEYILKIGNLVDTTCYQSYRIVIEGNRHFFADNPIPLRLRANNLGMKKDLAFLGAVYLEKEYGTGEFERVGPVSMEQPADENGETLFYVENILQSYLEAELPDPQQIDIRLMDKQLKRFYLAHFEKYDDPARIYNYTIVQIHYVMAGGLNKVEVAADDFFDVYLPEQRPFYSWQLPIKEVFTDQPEFLYYVVNEHDMAQFQVWIRLHFDDYSILEDNLFSVSNPSRYELYRFPTGYDQLRLSDYEKSGKKITYYEIWVTDGIFVPLSESRQYIIKREKPENSRYFFYLNSLGCYETLATTGYAEHSMKVSYETFEPTERRPLTLQEIGSKMLKKTGQEDVSVPVGHPSPLQRIALKDFALSNQVLLYQSGRLIPVETQVEETEYLNELEPLGEITINYKLPKDSKYTPDMAARKPIASTPLLVNLVSKTLVKNGNDGAINIDVIGGVPPYTFLWNNGETTQNLVGLSEGVYSVSVQDSGSPKSFGRLHNIMVYAQPISDVQYYGEGSFEEYTTATFNDIYEFSAPYGKIEIVTTLSRTGDKSLKLSTVVGAPGLPGFEFLSHNINHETPSVGQGRYKASMWVYIPSDTVLRPSIKGFDGSQLALTILQQNTSDIIEMTTRADVNIRGQWQYVEVVLTLSQLTNYIHFNFGYPSTSTRPEVYGELWDYETYLYIDDFSLNQI